jgi:hypothetical protein
MREMINKLTIVVAMLLISALWGILCGWILVQVMEVLNKVS